jgi:type II secretory pathway pseudopilin PulG
MKSAYNQRKAITLIEVIIAIAILGILIALLLPAIQGARNTANITRDKNNLKNIGLALVNYSSTKGIYPGILSLTGVSYDVQYCTRNVAPIYALLPYLEISYEMFLSPLNSKPFPIFISPADLSAKQPMFIRGAGFEPNSTSYVYNARIYEGFRSVDAGIIDGTSNTIGFLMKIAFSARNGQGVPAKGCLDLGYNNFGPPETNLQHIYRRSTFADAKYADMEPITSGSPPVTRGEHSNQYVYTDPIATRTFQVAPDYLKTDSRYASTPYRQGMPAAFLDGSVRMLSPNIAETVFWALVTPDGGEVAAE